MEGAKPRVVRAAFLEHHVLAHDLGDRDRVFDLLQILGKLLERFGISAGSLLFERLLQRFDLLLQVGAALDSTGVRVTGGFFNTASGPQGSVVTGGARNTVSGLNAVVLGGVNVTDSNDNSIAPGAPLNWSPPSP